MGETAYFALLAAIACERCFELALSRRNARRAFARGGFEVGQSHYALMTALHVLFLVSCAAENLMRPRPPALLIGGIGIAGTIIAQTLRYWAVITLGERWNTRVIVIPGEPPVTGGPFRHLRHPNYLAVVVELACLPLVRGLWITAIGFSLANAALLAVRISVEERALGAEYANVFASRRRLIPTFATTRNS